MHLVNRVRRLTAVLATAAMVVAASPAFAQDVSDEHLKAARAAVAAINATDMFDGILPGAAAGLKESLIQKNPDLQVLITSTVDEKALMLAGRRGDLENEAGLAYARVFSIEELNAIAGFYNSPAGKKLLSDGPIVSREVGKAADIWQNGIARDLAEEVAKVLASQVPPAPLDPTAPAPETATPAPEGAAPAPAN
ncbi:MAG: DUF2059 domain-containing protein [Pseudaminobacter sp.]|nr:DUF2059 domain-containing protein [Pseudaminobacter sp.]